MQESKDTTTKGGWYKSTWFTILTLIFIAPLGIFLLWKYSSWSKLWKVIATALASIVFIATVIGTINAPPTLTIDNVENGRIETEDSTYILTGTIVGVNSGTTLTVNGEQVPISNGKYSIAIELDEGDNTVTVEATKNSKPVREVVVIHRLTAAELKARKETEAARQKAEAEAAANKEADETAAKAEAEAAAKKKADEDAAAEAARNAPKTSFGDGTYLVNKDIQSGTYKTSGSGESCYYERRSDTSGSLDGIITNENATGPLVVTISSSDVAFKSQDCGTWVRQ